MQISSLTLDEILRLELDVPAAEVPRLIEIAREQVELEITDDLQAEHEREVDHLNEQIYELEREIEKLEEKIEELEEEADAA